MSGASAAGTFNQMDAIASSSSVRPPKRGGALIIVNRTGRRKGRTDDVDTNGLAVAAPTSDGNPNNGSGCRPRCRPRAPWRSVNQATKAAVKWREPFLDPP